MIDLKAPGRTAGILLLTLISGGLAAGPAWAKDVPGRKRCFVAGVETYKEEPVYRDKSSGYQRVQVPGARGERCFWEPLDYQAAAAAAPVRPSRAAPSTTGARSRALARAETAADRTGRARLQGHEPEGASGGAGAPGPASPPAERQKIASLPPQSQPRPLPQTRPDSQPEPQPEAQAPTQPQARAEPPQQLAPPPRPEPQRRPEPQPEPPPQPEPQPQARAEPPAPPQPVTPVLQPRGLTSGSTADGARDLQIRTRPVASGGTVSTLSSGPGGQSFMEQDQVVPPLSEEMQQAGVRTAMASLTPRTSVQGRNAETSAPAAPPEAAKSAPPEPEPAAAPARTERRASPAPASSISGDGKFVQLGSVTSYQKAKQFWTDVTDRYADELNGMSPNIVEADIPGKGVYFRVRVGPFPADEAHALCGRLDGNCLVVSK